MYVVILSYLTKFNKDRATSPSATLSAGSYYREMQRDVQKVTTKRCSKAEKEAMPHFPNVLNYIRRTRT